MTKEADTLGEKLSESGYLSARNRPRPGSIYYLALIDLLHAIERFKPKSGSRILDYGSGGSPYRDIFIDAYYCRADLPGDPTLDYAVNSDGTTSAPSENFDLVLSTQVLEHVRNPLVYLQECRRVLSPGGQLLLTTHGFFEEHPCPHDFFRWTAEGLAALVNDSGLEVSAIYKLTTGGRAAATILPLTLAGLATWRTSLLGFAFALANRIVRRFQPLLDRWVDKHFSQDAIVEASSSNHTIYIGLLVMAKRAS